MNTRITVSNVLQGNAALTTQGGLWKTALKEQVTQYLEKRIMLSDVFYDRGALDSAQLGSTSISITGDMVSFDPLNDHELPDGGMSFGNMRLATEDTGRKFPFNDRAVSRLDNIDQAGVIGKISKHIANRVVKVHNTKILTAANSGILAANNLTGTLSADMFYNLANRIERNEIDFYDDEYVMLCSNNVLQRLNRVDLWQNTDVNGGSRKPYVMGKVGGEGFGFDITWVNCGALMEQFFGNDRTMLFVRKDDIEYATEKGWEGLRIFIQNKGAQISSEATEIVAKDSFGAGIASDGFQANEQALKNRNMFKITFAA
jgi:hypothetical protein